MPRPKPATDEETQAAQTALSSEPAERLDGNEGAATPDGDAERAEKVAERDGAVKVRLLDTVTVSGSGTATNVVHEATGDDDEPVELEAATAARLIRLGKAVEA